MPIRPVDLVFLLSQPEAERGMDRSSNPAESLGRFASVTVWDQANQVGNLFPDVSGVENERGQVDVRCLFLLNDHETLPYLDCQIWVEERAEGGADIEIAVDPTSPSDQYTVEDQALTLETSRQLKWSAAQGEGRALRLGTLGPNQVKAFWVRRSVLGLPAIDRDFFTLRVRGETTQ